MIGLILPLIVRMGVPERFQRLAAWAGIVVGAIALAGLLWGAWSLWLDSVRDDAVRAEQDKREAIAAEAGQQSAEERADAALKNVMAEQARETAIAKADASEAAKAPEARSTVSAQDRALNCDRLRQAGLTGGAKYKELCR